MGVSLGRFRSNESRNLTCLAQVLPLLGAGIQRCDTVNCDSIAAISDAGANAD